MGLMLLILPKRMDILTRSRQSLWPRRIFFILCVLPVPAISDGIAAMVTAVPSKTVPNTWVKLECLFNLTEQDTTLVYWSDNFGDTLYVFEKGSKPEFQYGSGYAHPFDSGIVKNVTMETGNHTLMLYVRGCKRSPYTCYVWKNAIELAKPIHVNVSAKPPPVFTLERVEVDQFIVKRNGTHILACSLVQSTERYNFSMTVGINTKLETVGPHEGLYDSRNCTYSSTITKDYELFDSDEVKVQCIVEYIMGSIEITTTQSPGPCDFSSICKNGGTCKASLGSFNCQCPKGIYGEFCQLISMGESTGLSDTWIYTISGTCVLLVIVLITIVVVVLLMKKKKDLSRIQPENWSICKGPKPDVSIRQQKIPPDNDTNRRSTGNGSFNDLGKWRTPTIDETPRDHAQSAGQRPEAVVPPMLSTVSGRTGMLSPIELSRAEGHGERLKKKRTKRKRPKQRSLHDADTMNTYENHEFDPAH